MTAEIGPAPPVLPIGPVHAPVSWGAIFAGAVVGLAVSLLLSVLAAGLGLALGFPGLASRASLGAFTPTLGAYAIIVQVLSGAFAGYLAGRLRHVWLDVHYDEAHFRDTAHGLVAWALMTVVGVALAASVLGPYADQLTAPAQAAAMEAAAAAGPVPPLTVDAQRAANIAAQSSFFIAVGMLLSAFVAAVAARLGGQQAEGMHAKARL